MMHTCQFDYTLPPELIAQKPTLKRAHSRLLVVDADQKYQALMFKDMQNFLNENDLLVVNNTKVLPARILGHKLTGGKIEIMLERIIDQHCALVLLGTNKKVKLGQRIQVEQKTLCVVEMEKGFFTIKLIGEGSIADLFNLYGELALPPYISRNNKNKRVVTKNNNIAFDQARYQTVFAKHPGAVAAPTAGLHLDETLMNEIRHKGITIGEITLHIGAGTFQPVRVDNVIDHKMHKEYAQVSRKLCDQVIKTKQRGGKVIAVGTTVVRALESAGADGEIRAMSRDTELFIYPGYKFKVVDGLFTNFHLPRSTLLMMVCAFAGYDNVMQAYQYAVQKKYRFFSYGDAMFLKKAK